MPGKEERARRKEIQHQARDHQRQQLLASLPAPVPVLKALFDFLDAELTSTKCDHSLRFTQEFLSSNALDGAPVISWVKSHGGYCDCEALNNAEPVLSESIPGYDDIGKEGPVI